MKQLNITNTTRKCLISNHF